MLREFRNDFAECVIILFSRVVKYFIREAAIASTLFLPSFFSNMTYVVWWQLLKQPSLDSLKEEYR